MKILLISNMYPSSENDSYGVFVKNFVESMRNAGAEFSGICVIRGKKNGKLRKTVAYIKFFMKIVFNVIFRSTDIVYIHYPLQTAPILRLLRMFTARPFVLNFHGSDLFYSEKVSRFIKKQSEKLAREAELIVVPSEYFKRELSDKLKVDKNKIIVSPSAGLNFDVFNRNGLKSAEKRKYFAGFISRIDTEKGWDTFLEALKVLKDNNQLSEKKYLLLGSGKEDDKKNRLIKELDLEDIVDVAGSVPQNELPDFFKSMELFVFPSERKAESLGLVGLEAMACGIPVLGADNGGIADYINDGQNGLLFKKGDENDLAQKICEFREMTKIQKMSIEEKAYETATLYENSRVSRSLVEKIRKRFLPGEANGKV
jgi:glycosyltransferase involved in cell wall biosynthesis